MDAFVFKKDFSEVIFYISEELVVLCFEKDFQKIFRTTNQPLTLFRCCSL